MKKIDYTKYPLPRMRHHANPVVYFPLKQHKGKDFYYPPLLTGDIKWDDIYADGKPPRFLDIGCGLGKFLIESSLENTGSNFLGFEVRLGAVEWIENVIRSENLGNVKALWYSAVNGYPFIKSESLEKVFYFFPDPWVKKRHHKRRAFSRVFLDEIYRALQPGGKLYLMTDVDEVNEYQQKILNEHGGFDFGFSGDSDWGLEVKTNHEEFCISRKIPFIKMICEKKQF